MRRRDFVGFLAGAAAWPLAARAQRPVAVVGYLSSISEEAEGWRLRAFREGLAQTGFVEGRGVAIEYRGMQGHYDLLPDFIADFVRRPVAVIVVSGNTPAALAAKAATSTIPILFSVGTDAVQAGLVPNFDRPGGNVTGISNLAAQLTVKRLELLHELLPSASFVAVLVNPSNPPYTDYEMAAVRAAAESLGVRVHILNASTIAEIDAAFATTPQVRPDAVLVSAESFFIGRIEQLVALAARYRLPAVYSGVDAPSAGGLMSYGANQMESYHQLGVYAGRILKGEKPADLPVQQPTKFDLIINLKTAKTLGITFPLTLLGRADEVIE